MEPEVERVPAKDVAHVLATDNHELETYLFGDALEARRAHLAGRPNRESVAGDDERLAAVHARAKIRHQIPERARLPALVEGVQALRNAVGRGRDLIRVDRVELLRVRRRLGVPENERPPAHDLRGHRGVTAPVRIGQTVSRDTGLQAGRTNHMHGDSLARPPPVVPGTGAHGQRRKPAECGIGLRPLAQHELAATIARDHARGPAGRAETRALRWPPCLLALASIVHHLSMFTSEMVTRGVRVAVRAEYAPDRSRPGPPMVLPLYDHDLEREPRERPAHFPPLDHH